ncbi:MAG: M2 family metallopeptidase [Isosphaeraceae bacterium]|nr:M2 family metallopeptidase [Isosphaeraceae bacterium]
MITATCAYLLIAMHTAGSTPAMPDDARARAFIERHESTIRPLERISSLAWWNANVSGRDEDFAQKESAQNKLDAALSNAEAFAELKLLEESKISDPLVRRQIHILYLQYLEKQVDPELLRKISAKANAVEKAFNVYRARVGGKELSDSEVRKILETSKDSAERKLAWEASKGVGAVVEADLIELAKLRNRAATTLGFKNYHAMMLALNEQDQAEVIALFDRLDELTREPFTAAKAEIDARLAESYGIAVGELRPWHYHDPFFQETPRVFPADLDAPYRKADLIELNKRFYAGIGLPIDDVIARSDLYEKPGKSPHAFCTDIDREGDVRVLVNIVPNSYWAGTTLHELGHAVYSSKNIPRSLPYILRGEAHILTTEGIAMLFEKFGKDADWLKAMGVALDDPEAFDAAGSKSIKNHLLIFSRWCQVMLRFEKAMYENPDQDLSTLWWSLVEKYQGLKAPEGRKAPDYGAKIHVVSSPAYYHNYMMGQLFASQVHHAICREALGGVDPARAVYVGKPEVGAFLRAKVFEPGRTMPWNELTRFATGSPLDAKAFAADFQSR